MAQAETDTELDTDAEELDVGLVDTEVDADDVKDDVAEILAVWHVVMVAVPVALTEDVDVTVPRTLSVDDTDLECVNDLLYVDETVLDEDNEFVTDAVRQCVSLSEGEEE